MDEHAAQYEPDEYSLRVVGGGWCRVEDQQVRLLAEDGDLARAIDLADVVSVRRGGPDLTLVRRDADPISFTMADVDHARTVESAVEEIISSRAAGTDVDDTPRRWWHIWKRF